MSETGRHPISEVMGITMQKVKEMIDSNTIVGEPIRADGVTLVPVSKISVGFGSGGSDFGKISRLRRAEILAAAAEPALRLRPLYFL